MTITLTTPAILFPAISLLLLAYTNRFMALASVVRTLVNSGRGELDENRRLQIGNLNIRIQLVRWMQAAGVGSLFSCVVSIIMLYVELLQIGGGLFVLSLVLMMGSLALSFWEIMLSGRALQLELKRCESGSQPKAM